MDRNLELLLNMAKADRHAAGLRFDSNIGYVLKFDWEHTKRKLDDSGLFGRPNQFNPSLRVDANETAVISRSLVYVKSQEANVLYPDLKSRQVLPVSFEIPNGAEQYSIKTWDYVGKTQPGSNYADDMPRADVSVSETLAKIRPVINSFGYNVQELRNSAMMGGTPLDARKSAAARSVHERTQEILAATGDTLMGFTGLANNASVALVAGLTGNWDTTATDAQIAADVNALVNKPIIVSKQIHFPDTLLLGTKAFQFITERPAGTNWTFTIAQWVLKNNPYLKTIDSWVRLDTAGASSVPRAIAYRKDPKLMQFEIPQDFEMFPVQQHNLEFVVPCHSRCGGVSIRYPGSMAYGDGLSS